MLSKKDFEGEVNVKIDPKQASNAQRRFKKPSAHDSIVAGCQDAGDFFDSIDPKPTFGRDQPGRGFFCAYARDHLARLRERLAPQRSALRRSTSRSQVADLAKRLGVKSGTGSRLTIRILPRIHFPAAADPSDPLPVFFLQAIPINAGLTEEA
jgi:hypothetical protein